ncbi:MAG TPA: polyphenol oxidase family protein [Gemmatimonadales bacterium]
MNGGSRREVRLVGPSGMPRHELLDWPEPGAGVVAGVAGGPAPWDFRLARGDGAVPAWTALLRDLGGFVQVVGSRQVHGSNIGRHARSEDGVHVAEAADGHATTAPGILLVVTVADCVPVFLASRAGRALALLHAGWRGVAAGIVERGLQTMTELSGTPPSDIVMHCGIGICGNCYEVGPEVHRALGSAREGMLDLRAVIMNRARVLGLETASASPWCTAHDAGDFQSHRRSQGSDGRMAAYLGWSAA